MPFVNAIQATRALVLFISLLICAACANLPFASPGPGAAVKGMLTALAQGNLEEMAKYLPAAAQAELAKAKAARQNSLLGSFGELLEKGVTQVFIAALQWDINRKGGLKTIEINREQITGDTATVNFTIHFGNGMTRTGQAQCRKENGTWKVVDNK